MSTDVLSPVWNVPAGAVPTHENTLPTSGARAAMSSAGSAVLNGPILALTWQLMTVARLLGAGNNAAFRLGRATVNLVPATLATAAVGPAAGSASAAGSVGSMPGAMVMMVLKLAP